MQPPEEGAGESTRQSGGVADSVGVGDGELSGTARRVVDQFREEDVTFKAASIAYYAIASFIPLLIVSLAVLSLVGAADTFVAFLRGSASSSTTQVVDQALTNTSGRGGAGIVGFLAAVWGATRVFRGLSKAIAKIYDQEAADSLVDQIGEALIVLALLLVAFAAVSATGALSAYAPFDIPYSGLLFGVVGFVVLVLGLLPLYYVLPPTSVTLGHALPGAIVAAVGWIVLQAGFSVYAQNAGNYQAYGFLGAVLLFVVFLYFASVVLLTGAVVNATVDR